MCDAVVPDVNPLKITTTSIVLRVVFRNTVACAVPMEGVAGISLAPVRLADKVIMSAWLADTGRISADANASRQGRIEMSGSDSFMFASLAEELGLRMPRRFSDAVATTQAGHRKRRSGRASPLRR